MKGLKDKVININDEVIDEMKADFDIEFEESNEETETDYIKNQFKFTTEDYKELEKYIILYKQGVPGASDYIVSRFNSFLTKIVKFLKDGKMVICCFKGSKVIDKAIYKLVSLYIKKSDPGSKIAKFQKTSVILLNLFGKYEYRDIYNELVCVLLSMAKKYVIRSPGDPYYKENGSFHTYVDRCFHYEAYKSLNKMSKDVLHDPYLKSIESISGIIVLNESTMYDCEFNKVVPQLELKDEKAVFDYERVIEKIHRDDCIKKSNLLTFKESEREMNPFSDESLNLNWIMGVTCGEAFKNLSNYERKILVMSFVQNKTDVDIAKELGYHRTTINVHKRSAILKVIENFNNQEREE